MASTSRDSDSMAYVRLKSLTWSQELLKSLQEMRQTGDLCNVTIGTCEGEPLKAHGLLLCLASPFFRNMLKNKSSTAITCNLTDFPRRILEYILEFVYCGTAVVAKADLVMLQGAAVSLNFPSLANMVQCIIQRDITGMPILDQTLGPDIDSVLTVNPTQTGEPIVASVMPKSNFVKLKTPPATVWKSLDGSPRSGDCDQPSTEASVLDQEGYCKGEKKITRRKTDAGIVSHHPSPNVVSVVDGKVRTVKRKTNEEFPEPSVVPPKAPPKRRYRRRSRRGLRRSSRSRGPCLTQPQADSDGQMNDRQVSAASVPHTQHKDMKNEDVGDDDDDVADAVDTNPDLSVYLDNAGSKLWSDEEDGNKSPKDVYQPPPDSAFFKLLELSKKVSDERDKKGSSTGVDRERNPLATTTGPGVQPTPVPVNLYRGHDLASPAFPPSGLSGRKTDQPPITIAPILPSSPPQLSLWPTPAPHVPASPGAGDSCAQSPLAYLVVSQSGEMELQHDPSTQSAMETDTLRSLGLLTSLPDADSSNSSATAAKVVTQANNEARQAVTGLIQQHHHPDGGLEDADISQVEVPHAENVISDQGNVKPGYRKLQRGHYTVPISTGPLFECDICGRAFAGERHLKNHRVRHQDIGEEEKRFSCSECSFRTKHQNCLTEHRRIHTGEMPFECTYCQKRFRAKKTCKLHMYLHTGERPYKCEFCDRTFIISTHHRAHLRAAHTKERPYVCDICHRTFFGSQDLRKHRRYHAPDKVFKCSICDKGYQTKSCLEDHIRIKHLGDDSRRYKCEVCGRGYNRQGSLSVHRRMKHPAGQPLDPQAIMLSKQLENQKRERQRDKIKKKKMEKVLEDGGVLGEAEEYSEEDAEGVEEGETSAESPDEFTDIE